MNRSRIILSGVLAVCVLALIGAALASSGTDTDIAAMHSALSGSLTGPGKALRSLSCSGVQVWFSQRMVTYTFGVLLLATVVPAGIAYARQQRGASIGQVFGVIIYGMPVVALSGFLLSRFTGCA